eukprot:4188498-Prymnesium_polylepis.1
MRRITGVGRRPSAKASLREREGPCRSTRFQGFKVLYGMTMKPETNRDSPLPRPALSRFVDGVSVHGHPIDRSTRSRWRLALRSLQH